MASRRDQQDTTGATTQTKRDSHTNKQGYRAHCRGIHLLRSNQPTRTQAHMTLWGIGIETNATMQGVPINFSPNTLAIGATATATGMFGWCSGRCCQTSMSGCGPWLKRSVKWPTGALFRGRCSTARTRTTVECRSRLCQRSMSLRNRTLEKRVITSRKLLLFGP